MTIEKTTQYLRTEKRLLKKYIFTKKDIDDTLELFVTKPNDNTLHYKK